MKCPICENDNLVHKTIDIPYTYKGKNTSIKSVTGECCSDCGEFVLNMAESNRVSKEMLGFNKEINFSIVNPGFIADARKKLGLDQREAAEIFGGGINSFSRYENGKTKPPLALVQLLKILEHHPDLLSEIRPT